MLLQTLLLSWELMEYMAMRTALFHVTVSGWIGHRTLLYNKDFPNFGHLEIRNAITFQITRCQSWDSIFTFNFQFL